MAEEYNLPKQGLLVPGTITGLFDRKKLKNPDGSVSSTVSMSFEEEGKEILIPTVIGGIKLSPEAAVEHYHKTKQHLGIFDSPKNADAYAKALSEAQGRFMRRYSNPDANTGGQKIY